MAMKRLENVKWLFYDIGGPLLDDTPLRMAQYQAALEYYKKKNVVKTEQEFWELVEKVRRLQGSKPRRIVEMLAGSPEEAARDYEEIKKGLAERIGDIVSLYKPQPGIGRVLETLREKGYGLGIISNYDSWIRGVLEAHGLLGFFDVVVLAGEVGYKKPDPEIFRVALEKAGATARESVMVGDRVDADIAPAKRLGFYTVRMLAGEHAMEESEGLDQEPDATIRKPEEILAILSITPEGGVEVDSRMEQEKEIVELLRDLVWLNAVIATEIIRVTENTKAALGGQVPEKCKREHRELTERVVEIAKKWKPDLDILERHNLGHE